jgi:hypothetical protein
MPQTDNQLHRRFSEGIMTEHVRGYPVDMIGNEIRKNDLLMVRFPSENVICRVAEVRPVSLTEGMEIEGSIFLMVQLPHRGALPVGCVLKQPDEQRVEVATQMPKLVKQ